MVGAMHEEPSDRRRNPWRIGIVSLSIAVLASGIVLTVAAYFMPGAPSWAGIGTFLIALGLVLVLARLVVVPICWLVRKARG